jgi:serine/threonine protein kinase
MALSAAQMAQMSALLDEALDLDAEGRLRWLDALPPEYRDLEPALRQALLPQEGNHTVSDRLATLPKVDAATERISTLQPGERVGPWRLQRQLGAGGMAEVWLAERADGAFKREVALKLPMLSGLRKDLASRFARERDILAALEHPNIARMYDAGVTADGLPYLVMEYVAGQPLTVWCDVGHLGIRERLELFLQVLDAVQYAHGQRVIHRDIKPSNILVTHLGQVRLLDFGVAKLLAQGSDESDLTQLYGRALTPGYASPELVRGDEMGAGADVYSLGVVLHELLAGSRPYHLRAGASLALLEQTIATARVEPPSVQLGPTAGPDRGMTQEKLARRLRGDLDAIVLKTLAKTPADRYISVSALADDLQRYLSGEPVEAGPDRFLYRLSKVVLRLRGAQARSTLASSPNAREGVGLKTIAVLPFADISENKDQEYFADGLTDELIAHLTRFPGLRVIARTSSFYFKGKQATIAEIAKALKVGHVLEGSIRKSGNALRITARLIHTSDGSHLWSQTYDRSLSDIFKLQDEVADSVVKALQPALMQDAITPFHRSADSVPTPTKDPSKAGRERTDASKPNTGGYNLLLKGNYFFNRNTRVDLEKAIASYEAAAKADPSYALALAKLATAKVVQAGRGWAPIGEAGAKAREAVRQALEINFNLADAHKCLGKIYQEFDWNWAAAQAEYQRALETDPRDLEAAELLNFVREGIFGRFDSQLELLRRRVDLDPLDTVALLRLAWTLWGAGRLEESEAAFRSLLQLNPSISGGQIGLGITLLYMGRLFDALAEVEREFEKDVRLCGLAVVLWALGRQTEADAALAELKKDYSADAAYNIAEIHAYRGEVDAAFEWLDRAYRQRDSGMSNLRTTPLLRNLYGDSRFPVLLARMKLEGDPLPQRR